MDGHEPDLFIAWPERVFILRYRIFFLALYFLVFLNIEETFPKSIDRDTDSFSAEKTIGKIVEPINITATRSRKNPNSVPNATSWINYQGINDFRPMVTLDESISGLPGLFSQNPFNFAQDLRLSIRGFGIRSPFGVRGIKVLVDGFPETLPDGQTQLDSVDPGMIDHIEVIRGFSSSLYGNASGGVISITTGDGPELGEQAVSRLIFGGFGLTKELVKLTSVKNNFRYRLYVSHLELNGFRDNSATENTLVQGKFNVVSGPWSNLTISFNHFYSPTAEDPGSLTREQAAVNPKQANARNLFFSTGEKVEQQSFGMKYEKPFSMFHNLTLTAYLIRRNFSNRLPFVSGGIVEFDRIAPSASIKMVYDKTIFGWANRFIAGIDTQFQRDDRKRYNNNKGVKKERVLDQVEEVFGVGPYFRNELLLTKNIELISGFRYDRVHFRVGDRFLDDNNQSGSRTLSQWTGTIGAVFNWDHTLNLYGNTATVFETPTTTELINNPSGAGGFNVDLDSQKSVSYEVGAKGMLWNNLDYELALFFMRSEDEIIPFELPQFPQRTFFRNAGESERKGVELAISLQPVPQIKGSLTYTYSDFRFTDFISGDRNLEGNAIPGIPANRFYGKLTYSHLEGIFAEWEMQYVSDFFVDNENNNQNASYTLSNLRVGVKKETRSFRGSAFFGLNNLLDETYNANTRINAANGQFFEPGPPFNIYGGFSLAYIPSS